MHCMYVSVDIMYECDCRLYMYALMYVSVDIMYDCRLYMYAL